MHAAITRKQWGADAPGPMATNPLTDKSKLFVHWSTGRFNKLVTRRGAKAAVLGIQDFHIDDRGWSDIGYSYVVVQARGKLERALILEGRLFRNVPAAQEGFNTGNGAVCVLMGEGEQLLDGTLAALKLVYSHFRGKGGVKGHRDVMATECPGDKLYRHLNDIAAAPKRTPYLS